MIEYKRYDRSYVYMHLSQRTLDIMCYDDDDEWKNEIPDGEKHFSETINMIKAKVQQKGGQEHYELESRFLTGKKAGTIKRCS